MNAFETITKPPRTFLIGTGVVGTAILHAHAASGVSVCVIDQVADSLKKAVDEIATIYPSAKVIHGRLADCELPAAAIDFGRSTDEGPTIVIESIAENLNAKQSFFRQAERMFDDQVILCSNTSTIQIQSIADALARPQRVCGMHFFMPVDQRPAVEVVRAQATDESVIRICEQHVRQLSKMPLVVADAPGFIVNRLLSPYLNQSMLLLASGVSPERIEQAAKEYGMPMSPLELIDYIGTRTMLNAGRCFWQAFPSRLDLSLIVPRLVKKKQFGRHAGAGFYDYQNGGRSETLSTVAQQVVNEYATDRIDATDSDLVNLLAIPMWIEAALAFRDGVTTRLTDFDTAMQGGLGYQSSSTWIEYFDRQGSHAIGQAISRWSDRFASMQASLHLTEPLSASIPSAAIKQFAAG